MKKRGFTLIELLAVIVILAVIALIAVPLVMNIVEEAKKGSLERSYDMIEDSASNYVYANYQTLNIPDYQDYYLPVQELTDQGYLKNATEEMNQEYVIVKKSEEDMTFYYTGRDHNPYEKEGTIKEKIESDEEHIVKDVVVNGKKVNKVIGTKAEKNNGMKNYVWYSGNLWQVLETTEESVKMVLAHSITSIPYGESSEWESSWVRKWLNEIDDSSEYDGIFYHGLSRTDLLIEGEFCLDEPEVNTSLKLSSSGNHIVSVVTSASKIGICQNKVNETVGLLTFEDYVYANNGKEMVFTGDSFLDEDELMWTMTKYTENGKNNNMWIEWYENIDGKNGNIVVDTGGTVGEISKKAQFSITNSYGHGVRPVIHIKSDVIVTSGSGTKKDPYILISEEKKINKLNQATIGEYIYLDEGNNPNTTSTETVVNGLSYTYNKNQVRYRIIDILEDGSIKVERADVLRNLPDTVAISSGIYVPYYYVGNPDQTGCAYIDGTYYTGGCNGHNYFQPMEGEGEYKYQNSMNIGYYLNEASNGFYNWYSDEVKKWILNWDWDLPVTAHGKDYSTYWEEENYITDQTNYWNNTYDGEASAYIGLPSYGERYSGNDLNTSYWYINRWVSSSSHVGHVHYSGIASTDTAGYPWYGVRPVLHLRSNLLIQSGKGTSAQPYQLES